MGDYNNMVLLGNWSEERLQREFDLKLFLRKRERRELLLQKSRNLFSNLLREREMALSGTYIVFGFQTQILASDMIGSRVNGEPVYGLALSGLVDDRQVDYTETFSEGCLLSLSPIKKPCCRNTFTVTSYKDLYSKNSKYGQKLAYGEEFMLEIANYDNPRRSPLYVRYDASALPAPMERLPLYLSASGDTNCRWKAVPLLPRDRLEGEGGPVEQGAKLVIKNCVADKNLCVMNQFWMETFFGPECGVTLRNYEDIHKRTTAENIFKMVSDIYQDIKKN